LAFQCLLHRLLDVLQQPWLVAFAGLSQYSLNKRALADELDRREEEGGSSYP
jgi:hypothetical protein